MKARTLFNRDEKIRQDAGQPGSFIVPQFPEPKNDAERAAQEILFEDHAQTVTLHVYLVAELLEVAYKRGKDAPR
jgi:hypothetical protein